MWGSDPAGKFYYSFLTLPLDVTKKGHKTEERSWLPNQAMEDKQKMQRINAEKNLQLCTIAYILERATILTLSH